jgi:hypothetical protein
MKTKIIITLLHLLIVTEIIAQNKSNTNKSIEAGFLVAGNETIFYGSYVKYNIPLSYNKNFFYIAPSITAYFDFKGESTSQAYLKNALDMRILLTINPGYSLNSGKFQINLEVPIGISVAITKGTLVNEKIDFQQDYSNREIFFNYGVQLSPKFRVDQKNLISLSAFLPLVKDKAQSGYQLGLGWTRNIDNK